MSSIEIKLIKSSWQEITKHSTQAGKTFYKKLFEIKPSLIHLFEIKEFDEINDEKLENQINKLISTVNLIIMALTNYKAVAPYIRELGIKHLSYGAHETDYQAIEQALIETLEHHLADQFNNRTKEAWKAVYRQVSDEMIQATKNFSRQ